jgi:hypothetical protein
MQEVDTELDRVVGGGGGSAAALSPPGTGLSRMSVESLVTVRGGASPARRSLIQQLCSTTATAATASTTVTPAAAAAVNVLASRAQETDTDELLSEQVTD